MNKIAFFLTLALFLNQNLSTLRASDEESSSPLMMINRTEYQEIPDTPAEIRKGEVAANSRSTSTDTTRETRSISSRLGDDQHSQVSSSNLSEQNGSSSLSTPVTSEQDSRELLSIANISEENQYSTLSEEERKLASLTLASAAIIEVQQKCESSTFKDTRYFRTCQNVLTDLSLAQEEALAVFSDQSSYSNKERDVLLKINEARMACGLPSFEINQNEITGEESLLLPKSRAHQQLQACLEIKHKILSSLPALDHSDPFNFIRASITTVGDGGTFPLVLPSAFGMNVENCFKAGLAANIAGTLAASPYVSNTLLAHLPNSWSERVRQISNATQQFVDLDYLAYYIVAWSLLPAAPMLHVPLFIVPSALVKKGVSLLLQKESFKGSLEEQVEAMTSLNPSFTPSQQSCNEVIGRFIPDISASIARSFFSNLYDYTQGTTSAEEVVIKTTFSAFIYTAATVIYYTFYRALEMMPRTEAVGSYQSFARLDKEKVNQLDDLFSNRNDMKSSTFSSAQVEAVSQSLKFLDSPVTNLFQDPCYRYLSSEDSQEAFRALDALKSLRATLPFLRSTSLEQQEQAKKAFDKLKGFLTSRAGDIENNLQNDTGTSSSGSRLEALKELFNTFSAPTPSGDSERIPISVFVSPYDGYQSISQ